MHYEADGREAAWQLNPAMARAPPTRSASPPIRAGDLDDQSSNDDSGGDHRIGKHMQEGATYVEIALAAGGKHEGGRAIDENAERGDDHHDVAGDRRWMHQPHDRLPRDRADGDQQEQRVEQSRVWMCRRGRR